MTKPSKNAFDLTHDVKMSGKMGNLMPCCVTEVVPGDSFTMASDVFLRFAPLVAPVMHRIDVSVHYFFVPNRILWENWENFITNEPTGAFPQINMNGGLTADQKRLADYLGVPPVPPATGQTANVNALPFAAYQCIYNEYYRDQNLVPEVNYKVSDGINSPSELCALRKRAWEHDYFTSSLPFAQKGAAVDIPLGEVILKDDWINDGKPFFADQNGDPTTQKGAGTQIQESNENWISSGSNAGGFQKPLAYDPNGTLEVGATTINELRRAFRLQEWLEKNARGGTRYIENILAHFGVRSSDKRLQRPEYITGMKTPAVISEVLNMTGTDQAAQGTMAGHGVSIGGGYKGNYYAEEHGYIIGIMSVMPKTAYQQGIPKNYLKTDPTEFYWPSFAHIGEQEVQNQEVFAYSPNATNTFGYVPRYAEYKFLPSRIAGDFRTTLDFWHLGRIFTNEPTLSQQFIEMDSEDIDERIFAAGSVEDNLYIQVLNKIKAIRPMPVFGTPQF